MRIGSHLSFQDAVARLRAQVRHEQQLQHTPGPDGLRLQPHSETIFKPQDGPQARGTVLMFHGYTAGPWQYEELADKFHRAGYHVLAPRMPGHGCVNPDGRPTGKLLPDNCREHEWDQFIDQTVESARGLGAPLYAVGLSGGGNVALRLGEKYPETRGVAALAPYLGADLPKGLVFRLVDALDCVTFGAVGLLLDRIPFQKNEIVPGDRTPHTQGSLGQAKVMRHVGQDVKQVRCPVQLFSTHGDVLSGTRQDERLFERLGRYPRAWHHFGPEEKVPHAMVSPKEAPAHAEKVQEMIFNFIDKGQFSHKRP
jgi:esterase/lipase